MAQESPHGEGSVSLLGRLPSDWPGKLLVLALRGFLATDFIITLPAADVSAPLIEDPFCTRFLAGQQLL